MKVVMRSMLAFAAMFMLASLCAFGGCSTSGGSKATPEQAVFAIHQNYDVALTVALTYRNLPPCDMKDAPKVCASTEVVKKLRQADDVAKPALEAAQAAVRDPTFDQSTSAAVIASARQAVNALVAIAAKLPQKSPDPKP